MQEDMQETIKTYIYRSQNTIDQYIATYTILELCQEAERCLGSQVPKREAARSEEAVVKDTADAGQDMGKDSHNK